MPLPLCATLIPNIICYYRLQLSFDLFWCSHFLLLFCVSFCGGGSCRRQNNLLKNCNEIENLLSPALELHGAVFVILYSVSLIEILIYYRFRFFSAFCWCFLPRIKSTYFLPVWIRLKISVVSERSFFLCLFLVHLNCFLLNPLNALINFPLILAVQQLLLLQTQLEIACYAFNSIECNRQLLKQIIWNFTLRAYTNLINHWIRLRLLFSTLLMQFISFKFIWNRRTFPLSTVFSAACVRFSIANKWFDNNRVVHNTMRVGHFLFCCAVCDDGGCIHRTCSSVFKCMGECILHFHFDFHLIFCEMKDDRPFDYTSAWSRRLLCLLLRI